jgi:hypothetical protein
MKKLFILFAILFCLVSCTSKDDTIQKDKELGQQLDTLPCMTESINLSIFTHAYLFERMEKLTSSDTAVFFGKYVFNVATFPDEKYLLTNPSGPYSIYITIKNILVAPAGSEKTMIITKLCDNK